MDSDYLGNILCPWHVWETNRHSLSPQPSTLPPPSTTTMTTTHVATKVSTNHHTITTTIINPHHPAHSQQQPQQQQAPAIGASKRRSATTPNTPQVSNPDPYHLSPPLTTSLRSRDDPIETP